MSTSGVITLTGQIAFEVSYCVLVNAGYLGTCISSIVIFSCHTFLSPRATISLSTFSCDPSLFGPIRIQPLCMRFKNLNSAFNGKCFPIVSTQDSICVPTAFLMHQNSNVSEESL